ncbi:MAG TPA: hypothetical protein VF881_15650 [Polyangiaceae bacterium]
MNAKYANPANEFAIVLRWGLVSLLVLGLAAISSDASAHFQIPATAGTAGNPLRNDYRHWNWSSDGFVRRTNSLSGGTLEWVVPLPFHHEVPAGGNDWSVQVMASYDTECSLQWRANDLPTATPEGTVAVKQTLAGGGPLDLTASGLCPVAGAAANCVTGYSTAFVSCTVPGEIALGGPTDRPAGFVGAVTYTINPHL